MNLFTKISLIVAASLVGLGIILFLIGAGALRFNFLAFDTRNFQTNTHEVSESFESLSIVSDTARIQILPAEGETAKVVCVEYEKESHAVSVEDGTLTIRLVDTRKWYDCISFFSYKAPSLTVYLPAGEYAALTVDTHTGDLQIAKDFKFASADITLTTGDVKTYASVSDLLKIKTSTGDIHVENLSVGALDLSVTTGKVTVSGVSCDGDVSLTVSTGKASLSDLTCQNLSSTGRTGDLTMTNVIAKGRFDIERSTGDVTFEKCDAAELSVKTDTGSVRGTLLSEKIFMTHTDTGKIDTPETISGGVCKITTDTGDIKIRIQP